jgi:hypothetical protein
MTMPVMEPDLDAQVLRDWAGAIDDGPFSALCWGERIAFDNPESLTLLGAVAAWTERVRLVTTVIVPQLHDPVMLAKADVTYRETLSYKPPTGDGTGPHPRTSRPVVPLRWIYGSVEQVLSFTVAPLALRASASLIAAWAVVPVPPCMPEPSKVTATQFADEARITQSFPYLAEHCRRASCSAWACVCRPYEVCTEFAVPE